MNLSFFMQNEANFGWSRPGHRGAGRAGSLHAEKKDVKDVIPCAAMSETQSNCWEMSPGAPGRPVGGSPWFAKRREPLG
jgi:hypothetical protein